MSGRVTLFGAVAVAALGAALLCAPAQAAPSSGPPSGFGTNQVLNGAAMAAVAEITDRGQSAPEFAGVQITDAGVEVSSAGPVSTGLADAISAGHAKGVAALQSAGVTSTTDVPVQVRTVGRSMSQLQAETEQLNQGQGALASAGIVLSSWGPDVESNSVLVHLRSYSAAAAQAVRDAFGPAVTVATDSEQASGSGRLDDSPAWFGGDKLTRSTSSTTYVTCTSWFSVTIGTGSYVMTSGHCGSGTWKVGSTTVGSTSRSVFTAAMDAQTFPASSAGYIWSDPTSTTRDITGSATSDPIGGLICTGGYVDREVCSVKILAGGQTVNYDGVAVQGLVKAHQTGGRAAFTQGDSGGPVYSAISTNAANAYGMLEAHVIGDNSSGWYMPVRTMKQFWGLALR